MTDHWNNLAAILGADPAPEPTPKTKPADPVETEANAPESLEDVARLDAPPRRVERPVSAPPARRSSNWDALASELGIETPAAPTSRPQAVAEPEVRKPARPRSEPRGHRAASRHVEERVAEVESSEIEIEQRVVEIEDRVIEQPEEESCGFASGLFVEEESAAVSDVSEPQGGDQEEPRGKRRRKRRRRGGKGRSEQSVPAAESESDSPLESDIEAPKVPLEEMAVVVDPWEEPQAAGGEVAEVETEGEKRGRRRRRRSRRTRSDAPRSAEKEEVSPRRATTRKAADVADKEHPDLADHDEDHFDEHDEDSDSAAIRIGFRNIPTWQDAVGTIVEKNLESRSKRPGNGNAREHGGGRGGRGHRRGKK